jgi:GT2 family glycosyltransferase
MKHWRATIQVVTYNSRHVLPACLDALRETIGLDDEVVVVDNASGDGTADHVTDAYPWVRLVRLGRNAGFGAAHNLGASIARGEYLVILNPDTRPLPGWLDALLDGLTRAPGPALATAKLLLATTPDRVDAFGNDVHLSGITTCHGWREPASVFRQVEEVAAVSGACFALARALF